MAPTVTVLEAAPRALGRAIPPEIADRIVGRHREAGVEITFDARLKSIDPGGVALGAGAYVPADLVVEAVGVVPNTDLAAEAGLTVENGVAVDAMLTTSDPAVFAAGDCAAFPYGP